MRRRVRQPDHARRLDAAGVDADHAAAAHRLQLVLVEHLDLEPAGGGDLDGALGHHPAVRSAGRRVGQVAGERRGRGGDLAAVDAELDAGGALLADDQRQAVRARLRARRVLRPRKRYGGEQRALDDGLAGVGAVDALEVGQRRGQRWPACRRRAPAAAAASRRTLARQLVGVADADGDRASARSATGSRASARPCPRTRRRRAPPG